MQDPKTGPSSFDAPMGHTLSPVDATLHRSTAAQPQAPWVFHSLCGKSMQILHSLLIWTVLDWMAVHNIAQPGSPHFHPGGPRTPAQPLRSTPTIPLASSSSRAKSIPASWPGSRNCGATAVVLEVVVLLGLVDRQALLANCHRLFQSGNRVRGARGG